MRIRFFSNNQQKQVTAERSKTARPARGVLVLVLFVGVISTLFLSSCANFDILGENLAFMDSTYIVVVKLKKTKELNDLRGAVIQWDESAGQVLTGDFTEINNEVGNFGFFVKSPRNQFVMAYNDTNGSDKYEEGEPAWIHSDPKSGKPVALEFDDETQRAVVPPVGELKKSTRIPTKMISDVKKFAGGRTRNEVISGLQIPIALGDIAKLNEPRFSSARGVEGLWQPAEFPLDSGIGIFFLEKYDPSRIPVLFVYGAAGSPQDWKTFFAEIDHKKYQPWFFYYPTGRRLDEMGGALNKGVESLHDFYGFERLHVVAHSMGGLVARSFVAKNVLEDGNGYIDKFVTISTPWGGHEAAAQGVKRAPEVVPSWRDMVAGSDFQVDLYAKHFGNKVDHLLIYGDKSSKSLFLPKENDGTVSVKSVTFPAVLEFAVRFRSFYADHVGILSEPEVIKMTQDFLAGEKVVPTTPGLAVNR